MTLYVQSVNVADMSNLRLSVAEIAEKLSVEREEAYGLTKFLVAVGLVRHMGDRRPESGKGRSISVYSFEDDFEDSLKVLLRKSKLT